MKIQGIGMISALGRGIRTLEAALERGAPQPSHIDVPFQDSPFPVYAVAKETLNDPILRSARRADRFSKMAVLAACDAVKESGTDLVPERTGIILSTAFGPHPTVFSFLDEILEFGDAGVSPTVFSHSVHNAAASYISVALGLAGPSMTLTSFSDPFGQSLLLARNWLDQRTCDHVLVGCVEECGAVLEYIVSQKLAVAESASQMKPFFADGGPVVIPGEGAVFFLLGNDPGASGVSFEPPGPRPVPDLWVADFEAPALPESAPAGCWSYLAGFSPLSTAFSCAAAVLMLKEGHVYNSTSLIPAGGGCPVRAGCVGRAEQPVYLKKEEL